MSAFEVRRSVDSGAAKSSDSVQGPLSPLQLDPPDDFRSARASSHVPPRHHPASVLLASDFDSFKQQQTLFVILNLFVLAALLLIHTLFSSHWGHPSARLVAVLA